MYCLFLRQLVVLKQSNSRRLRLFSRSAPIALPSTCSNESLPPLPTRIVSPVANATEDPKPLLPRGPAARPKKVTRFTANRRRKKPRRGSVLSPIQSTD